MMEKTDIIIFDLLVYSNKIYYIVIKDHSMMISLCINKINDNHDY